MFEIVIKGTPASKARPRFGNGRAYKSNKQRDLEDFFVLQMMPQFRGRHKIEKGKPIKLSCTFIMPIPKSTSAKKRKELIGQHHTKKPDMDNLLKFVKDCMNRHIWHDDAQVAEYGRMRKIYGTEPKTIIQIEQGGL